MARKRVGILIFDDVEVLDFCGPFEVFSVTRLENASRRESLSPYEVLLVAEAETPVTTTGGMTVMPQVTCAACPPLDVLMVPGGWGTRALMRNATLLDWLRERAEKPEILASVCTGSMVLGAAGLLDGHRATTHWASLDWMRDALPAVTVDRERHFVIDGRLWSSAGISAGIDMALRIVAELHGEVVARATARYMEYPYPEDDRRRIEL